MIMQPKLADVLARRLETVQTVINDRKIRSYDALVEFAQWIGAVPPHRDEIYSFYNDTVLSLTERFDQSQQVIADEKQVHLKKRPRSV